MISSRSVAAAAAVVCAAFVPLAQAQQDPGEWRQTMFLYGMGAAIEGDAQVGNLQVPVDVSMSELFSSLKFGAMAAYRIENDEWSVTGDVTYMNLGQRTQGPRGQTRAELDLDQLTMMATLGRRLSPNVEALFSLAYFDLSADLELRVLNQSTRASRDADWIDPQVGLQYSLPFADKWTFNLRGDIGGFGIGSDLSWHALTTFRRQNTDRFGWYFGYRVLAYDYEDGNGRDYQRYDLRQHGPGIGVAFSF